MRYDGDHKTATRARVLKEAAREIRAKGPAGIAVAGVMARAGLTHGGFYAHFSSRDDMVAAAIGTMFEEARGRFDRTLAERDPAAALVAYIDFYLSAAHRDAREHGCPLAALSSDLPRMGNVSRERFGAGVAALTGRLADAIARHGAMDVADATPVAQSMLAQLVGGLSLARSVADTVQSDAILAASRADLKHRLGLKTTP
ncbi:MAG: TetR/AcrR family transcriptional regulator [Pseudomonadota bacterium]